MQIRLNHCEDLGDWYTIVRAEHDGREWVEQIDNNSSQFMCSERLSPEACIEGNASEMLEVADAIRSRSAVSFKRVAVSFEPDGVHFRSPKNSERDAVVTEAEADELAEQIVTELRN